MLKFIKNMVKDKKEYKRQMERAEELPKDYLFVFKKIHGYIWSFAGGDGSDMLKTQGELLELFEESAKDGKNVLDIIGKDVVAFCDELIHDTKLWTDNYRKKLNSDIAKRLEK